MATATIFSVVGMLSVVKMAVDARRVPGLLVVKNQLVSALKDPDVPGRFKRRPDGEIRIMLSEVQRALDELNDEETRCLLRQIECARQDAEAVLRKEHPSLKKIAPFAFVVRRIHGLCEKFASRGFMIQALGRVKLGSAERGNEALDGLFRIRDELVEKLSALKNTDTYKRAVHSAVSLLKAAKETNNSGAVKAHERTLRELGAAVA